MPSQTVANRLAARRLQVGETYSNKVGIQRRIVAMESREPARKPYMHRTLHWCSPDGGLRGTCRVRNFAEWMAGSTVPQIYPTVVLRVGETYRNKAGAERKIIHITTGRKIRVFWESPCGGRLGCLSPIDFQSWVRNYDPAGNKLKYRPAVVEEALKKAIAGTLQGDPVGGLRVPDKKAGNVKKPRCYKVSPSRLASLGLTWCADGLNPAREAWATLHNDLLRITTTAAQARAIRREMALLAAQIPEFGEGLPPRVEIDPWHRCTPDHPLAGGGSAL